jgi:hypothetical protein
LEKEEIREAWISKLSSALPDGNLVTRLLGDLPSSLRQEWKQLIASAAGRNPRTPVGYFHELREKHSADWERATQSRPMTTETMK